jgi:hypothetical protein
MEKIKYIWGDPTPSNDGPWINWKPLLYQLVKFCSLWAALYFLLEAFDDIYK